MKVNIYYGQRGVVCDPALFAIEKIEKVFDELNIKYTRYNLIDYLGHMSAVIPSLKEADGVILATTLEWFSVGGAMLDFLDNCWQYGDKEIISNLYMYPLVLSKTYGEREAKLSLIQAWELLGGKSLDGFSSYVSDENEFENNEKIIAKIEEAGENIYRTLSKKPYLAPSSNSVIKANVLKEALSLTPKETEQLSKYAASDEYVATQKKDVAELASIFKDLLEEEENGGDDYYTNAFTKAFIGNSNFQTSVSISIQDKSKNISLKIKGEEIDSQMGENPSAKILIKLDSKIFDDIINGRMTFQRAFMSGQLKYMGDFTSIKNLDGVFNF